ncbi:MAG: alkaline phosphatase D family protein, partial [Brevundimonas sp.]
MRIDRRRVLGLIGAGAAAPAASARARQAAAAVAFRHGVASGDPLGDRVMLWTRVSPDRADAAVSVDWRVRPLDSDAVVASGTVVTGPERDHTVKVDVGGLQPGAGYRFDFSVGDVRSPEGRTRTLPAGGTEEVVLAVASCQLHPGGLFNAYEAMAGLERLDAVVHLGDYIYEYGAGTDDYGMVTGAALNRVPEPAHEIVSLDDYRRRHAQYKTDADLQAAHARAPFICVWDDHEVANDSWTAGAQNHQPRDEG